MKRSILQVGGMNCGGGVRKITGILTALDGVAKAEVSLEPRRAVVDCDPQIVGIQQLKRSVVEAGFEIAN